MIESLLAVGSKAPGAGEEVRVWDGLEESAEEAMEL
jgi:hypothetical protein